jgi:hypothetical protein
MDKEPENLCPVSRLKLSMLELKASTPIVLTVVAFANEDVAIKRKIVSNAVKREYFTPCPPK